MNPTGVTKSERNHPSGALNTKGVENFAFSTVVAVCV